MKSIHLLRHAKSSWEIPSLEDKLRPLNPRGNNACAVMAPILVNSGCDFSNVFSSTAVRAQSTIKLIASALPFDIDWQLDDTLYFFDDQVLFSWLSTLNDEMNTVMVVGHNPALLNLCNNLSNQAIDILPTCSYVQLSADILISWQNLSQTNFSLKALISPKSIISNI